MQDAAVNIVRGISMAKGSKREWALIGGGVAACAACCAPLLAPLFIGAGGAGLASATAGGLLGMSWSEIACIGIIVALVAGAAFLTRRSMLRPRKAAACACEVEECASCKVGGACDPNGVSPQSR